MGCHTWFYSSKENLEKGNDCEFHDAFRRGGYPEIVLNSYEETIAHIEDKCNGCQIDERTIPILKEFWSKYPNGKIEFG